MAKPLYVTQDRWRAAVKLLTQLEVTPDLSVRDQRKLGEFLRGPFKDGMAEDVAERILREGMEWEVQS